MKTDRYIACYEHGKPEYFRTIAEISQRFGIRAEYATELVKRDYKRDKPVDLPDGRRCWLDFLALPGGKTADKKRKEYIAFSADGANFIFNSVAEAERALGVSDSALRKMIESGEARTASAGGIYNKMTFCFDELFTGEE